MNRRHRITRRRFLTISAAGAVGVLAGCRAKVVEVEKVVKETVEVEKVVKETVEVEKVVKETVIVEAPAPSKYQEAPEWAELVAQGKLAPVDERMPLEPLVVPRRGGKYGGTLRLATTDKDPSTWTTRNNGNMQGIPMRLNEDLSGVVPNFFKDCVYSDDKKTIRCYLREGAKYSDGSPHTVDDWIFWRDNIQGDPEVIADPFSYYTAGGELLTINKIDDYNMEIVFKEPKPFFVLQSFAHCLGFWGNHTLPVEYAKQFHIKYNPNADEEAKAEGWEGWGARMFAIYKVEDSMQVGTPHTGAYNLASVQPDAVRFHRNPYFWAVDQDGNQLPYIDELLEEKIADQEVVNAKLLAGQVDIGAIPFKDYQTYAEGAEKGNYVILDWTAVRNYSVYSWNQNYTDEVWRTVFRDKRFRQAMSVALNREEMNQVAFIGLATPSQFTAHPTTPVWKQEYADAWAQYDPDLANQLLDEMGLEWDDKHELRVLPDGRPTEFSTLIWTPAAHSVWELAVESWLAVGIKVNYKDVERSLTHDATLANELAMSTWWGDEIGTVLIGARPKWFVAPYTDENALAPLWGKWYESKGASGEEPPEEVKKLYEAHDMWQSTGDWKYMDIQCADNAENLWTVGTLIDEPNPQIANKDLVGLVPVKPHGWDTLNAHHLWPCAWYFDR